MTLEFEEIGALLDTVCPLDSARATLAFERLDRAPLKRNSSELFHCDARWVTHTAPIDAALNGPRHQTLRRRGVAPAYLRPEVLEEATEGRLVLLPDGLSLEPEGARIPCTHISAEKIIRAAFYKDCVEVIHDRAKRTLIQCSNIDALDVLFQAYY